MEEYVTLHGDKWKTADLKESVEWVRKLKWKKKKWIARAALASKGSTSDYVGQKYNLEKTKLIEDGWSHDHCEVCWWTLCESDNPEEGEGYTTNGHTWLCGECFENFVQNKA